MKIYINWCQFCEKFDLMIIFTSHLKCSDRMSNMWISTPMVLKIFKHVSVLGVKHKRHTFLLIISLSHRCTWATRNEQANEAILTLLTFY